MFMYKRPTTIGAFILHVARLICAIDSVSNWVHLLARSPPATQQNPDEIAEASAAERVKNERNEAIANSSGAKQGLLDVLIEKGPKTTNYQQKNDIFTAEFVSTSRWYQRNPFLSTRDGRPHSRIPASRADVFGSSIRHCIIDLCISKVTSVVGPTQPTSNDSRGKASKARWSSQTTTMTSFPPWAHGLCSNWQVRRWAIPKVTYIAGCCCSQVKWQKNHICECWEALFVEEAPLYLCMCSDVDGLGNK